PEIDWKVKSLYGYPFKCFLDAYKGYHRIQMAESNEEKTAFHTSHGVYCYTKNPFGLKNAGTTSQCLVDKAFDSQVGQNIEVGMNVLRTIKEVQSLNVNLASLNRFLSKLVEKSLPLFKTLKKYIKKSDFHWTPEVEQAFKQLKQHLLELPVLVAPKPKEELIVYLSASCGAISAVLMTKRDTIQTPVYFVSRALQDPELNYTPMEKLVLALILADFLVEKSDEAPPDTSMVETPQVPQKPEKSIQEKEVVTVGEEDGPTWMTPIMEYLKDRTLPDDRKEASKLRIKARQKGKVFYSRYRLLYEVDRGESRGENHRQSGEEVRVGQHNVSLWPSQRNSIEQRYIAQRQPVQGLTYGTEAVIPVEIRMPTYRTVVVDVVHNDEELRLNLDLLEERRECVAIREANAKLKMTKYYNARVRGVTFRPGDFVYRSNDASHAVDGGGNLA
nr:reverse transcriptase domain-containing protein [Tanacetum cinerariifolium]